MRVPVVKRVLFISYAFPPTGGAGVQRSTKFVKFLPRHGWLPTVLTVANPSVPVQDHQLASEISLDIPVLRSRTWEPGYGLKRQLVNHQRSGPSLLGWIRALAMGVLQPDPQILWNSTARRMASRHLQLIKHAAIFVTGPPFSSFLLGCQLKKQFGLPLTLDFRDEWALVSRHMENHRPGHWSRYRQSQMRRRALQAADAVLATTKSSAQALAAECQAVRARPRVECIYNGFDIDDLRHIPSIDENSTPQSRWRLVYTGTLWNLTDIEPLVNALQRIRPNDSPPSMELEVAGRCTESQCQILKRIDSSQCLVRQYGYLPHEHSLAIAATADTLLLTLADQPGAERVVPAKLFEYMALRKPILAIVPAGETRDILEKYSPASIFHPRDTESLATWLVQQLTRALHDSDYCDANDYLEQFSRSNQTAQLASLLDGLTHPE